MLNVINIKLAYVKVTVPNRTAIKDGGADALVELPKHLSLPAHFPSQKMLFQVKATDVKSLSSELKKEKVKKYIKDGWTYILFCNKFKQEGLNLNEKESFFKKEIQEKLKIPINFYLYDHNKILEWINYYPQVQIWFHKIMNAAKIAKRMKIL